LVVLEVREETEEMQAQPGHQEKVVMGPRAVAGVVVATVDKVVLEAPAALVVLVPQVVLHQGRAHRVLAEAGVVMVNEAMANPKVIVLVPLDLLAK
jgi:hypothetical protein